MKELEIALITYIALEHTQEECIGFIDGFKAAEEKMYSKEDMLEFTKYLLSKKITKAKNISDLEEYLPKEFQLLLGELMRNGKELISEWFEEFKNK